MTPPGPEPVLLGPDIDDFEASHPCNCRLWGDPSPRHWWAGTPSTASARVILVVTHERCGQHEVGVGHPERPARLSAALAGLRDAGLDDAVDFVASQPAIADQMPVVRVVNQAEWFNLSPGHVSTLIAHPKGLAGRNGHTEAVLEVLSLAGIDGCGVLCEILNPDGAIAGREELERLTRVHQLARLDIGEVISYRQGQSD